MIVGDWSIFLLPMFFKYGRKEGKIVIKRGFESERKLLVLDLDLCFQCSSLFLL